MTSVQTGTSIVRNSYRDGEGNLLRATITDNSPRFPGGYFSHDGKPYYHITNYQGYNAKLVNANGINEYDFAARQYVASQMRFPTPDPLAEERPGPEFRTE